MDFVESNTFFKLLNVIKLEEPIIRTMDFDQNNAFQNTFFSQLVDAESVTLPQIIFLLCL